MAQNCVVLEGTGREFTEYFGELYKTLYGKEEAGVINILPQIFHLDAVTDRIKEQLKLESFESDFYTEMRASPPTTNIIIKTLDTIDTLLKDATVEEIKYLQKLQKNIQLYQKWAEFHKAKKIDIDRLMSIYVDSNNHLRFYNKDIEEKLIQEKRIIDYTQGEFNGSLIECFISSLMPNISPGVKQEKFQDYSKTFFSYKDAQNRTCGLAIIYSDFDPNYPFWMILDIKNCDAPYHEREYKNIFSESLVTLIQHNPDFKPIEGFEFYNPQLFSNTDSKITTDKKIKTDKICEELKLPEKIAEFITPIFQSDDPKTGLEKRNLVLKYISTYPEEAVDIRELDRVYAKQKALNSTGKIKPNNPYGFSITTTTTVQNVENEFESLKNSFDHAIQSFEAYLEKYPEDLYRQTMTDELVSLKGYKDRLFSQFLEANIPSWRQKIQAEKESLFKKSNRELSPREAFQEFMETTKKKVNTLYQCLKPYGASLEEKSSVKQKYDSFMNELNKQKLTETEQEIENSFWQKQIQDLKSSFSKKLAAASQKPEIALLQEKLTIAIEYVDALSTLQKRAEKMGYQNKRIKDSLASLSSAAAAFQQGFSKSFLQRNYFPLLLAGISIALITSAILLLPATPLILCLSIGAGLLISAIIFIIEKEIQAKDKKTNATTFFKDELHKLESIPNEAPQSPPEARESDPKPGESQ